MRNLRRERLGTLIREEVSLIFEKELKDPRVGFVTITRVEVSQDCRFAKVFVSVLGSEEEIKETMEGLNHALGFIRSRIAQRLELRYVPTIAFEYDSSLAKSARVQEILKSLEEKPE
ncbi:MAG: 30S ribosome-binding factor RbfA [Coprothermobacterota bacterium]|nr:30S ribosome-binding factor RbfA [Coprothermobacterota bacterium]